MKITKFDHCCLLIEHKGLRVLFDPGLFSHGFESLSELDAIIITHEHMDHFHVPALKGLIEKNPTAILITNGAVSLLCKNEGIETVVVNDGDTYTLKDMLVKGIGSEHAEIFEEFGKVQNTGYMLDNNFFFPGDAFTDLAAPVDILAVPIAGPWMALKQAINYARKIKPKFVIPVHDAVLSDAGKDLHCRLFEMMTKDSITFIKLSHGQPKEF